VKVQNLIVSTLLTITLVFIHSDILASDFSGPVVCILDGDTLEVLQNARTERIRLSGIDCPEKGQAYGNNAKQAASELVFE
jgi:micrococcal nuclease